MNDRCLFIQHEIGTMQIDDFCNLPYVPVYRNVVQPVDGAYERHSFAFETALTH